MSRRVVTMSVGAVLLLVLGVAGARLPVPFVALGPGPTVNTLGAVDGTKVITVTDASGRPREVRTSGQLRLVTVGVQPRLNLFTALRGWFDDSVAVVPREEVYPPNQTQQQVDKENQQEFTDSQDAAEAAALGELHYPREVLVSRLAPGSPSKDRLRAGDVVTTLDGAKVQGADALIAALTKMRPGTAVTVGYTRGGKPGTVVVDTTSTRSRKGAALGVLVEEKRVSPFTIKFSLGNIGGPSAGMMFALGVIEKLTGQDLSGGKPIAGTGTIDANGNVGPIGGISQKMRGAKRDGARTFLVPEDNCAEARSTVPSGMRLVRIATLHDAVTELQDLRTGGNPPTC